MSRTRRRAGIKPDKWITHNSEYDTYSWRPIRRVPKEGKELAKALAMHYSDNGTYRFKEPGPSWFRNMFTERPQRREARRQLRRYLLGEDIEVILNPKNPLEYWT